MILEVAVRSQTPRRPQNRTKARPRWVRWGLCRPRAARGEPRVGRRSYHDLVPVPTLAPDGAIADPDDLPPTFVDPTKDTALRAHGYVTMPVLDADEVAWITEAHQRLVDGGGEGEGMAVDYMRADRRIITEFNEVVGEVWERRFPAIFADHRPVFSTCVVKHPGRDSAMFLHEDRSYVDERSSRSGTLWIPLVDTGPDIDNGCLHVVPGSHRAAISFAGSHTPELLRPYAPDLERALVPVEVPAGHGLFYDTRTLHASPPNRTATPRPAIAVAVAPRTAPLIHVVGTGATRRAIHRVDEQFFLAHGPEQIERSMPATYPVIEELDDVADPPPPQQVRAACGLGVDPRRRTLLPGDLRDHVEGRPRRPSSPAVQRVGALEAVTMQTAALSPTTAARAPIEEDKWLPVSLWPRSHFAWWVGDPLVQLALDGALVMRLHRGERVCLSDDVAFDAVSVIEGSSIGAGLAGPMVAEHLPTGRALDIGGCRPCALWNHGPGRLDVTVHRSSPDTRRTRRDHRALRREVQQLVQEVEVARR